MNNRLRELREDSDLLQKDIAEYLCCSQVCYSRYELGARDIPTDVLVKIAQYYNISIDYILHLTDEKRSYK
ncbi:MAG: helix-turn-helix transcriptional regulator [Clostridia bacterium]|nr:helix-turn-helix transcriptional regulator [Clostridia bacterium]